MEPMTFDQLLADVREELDDEVKPYLHKTERLTRLINESISEANIRGRFLVDTTSELCTIPIVAGTSEYAIDPSIITLRSVRLASEPYEHLHRTSVVRLDATESNWRGATGRPSHFVRHERNRILITPTPTETDSLKLDVWRHPIELEAVGPGDDLADTCVPVHLHAKLLHWVVHRALMKRDGEVKAMAEAGTHLELFDTAFGQRPPASSLTDQAMDARTSTMECWH
jgi:hypothetical protein